MRCPLCGKEAKTARGLTKHLTGTEKYGGHSRDPSEAVRIAGSATGIYILSETARSTPLPVVTSTTDDGDDFFYACLAQVVDNKNLPKYQFERVIDFCLGTFLPLIMSAIDGAPVELVTQEFPLKKPQNNQSTNMDYVLFRGSGGTRPTGWIFLELKTDPRSVRVTQNDINVRLITDEVTMQSLVEDLETITANSSLGTKYAEHHERLEKFRRDFDKSIELVYLGSTDPGIALAPGQYRALTFKDLAFIELSEFNDEWRVFKELALPTLAALH